MNALWLLMGLLVLSYIGSFLVGGRVLRGFGLPSGTEYVVLGVLIGPSVFGLLERSTLVAFEPVANVALGWLTLVVGLEFGFVGNRRVRPARIAAGVAMSVATGALVALAVWLLARRIAPGLTGDERALLAVGVGAAAAETTRHAVLWVMQRYGAAGRLSSLIAELADSDDLGPILLMGAGFAMFPSAAAPWPVPFYGWVVVTVGLGVVLGLVAVVLLGADFRLIQSWGVLLGTSLLTIGLAGRVGVSPLLATFAMGVTIAGASRHRDDIVEMITPTERPVLLPALLLAGAHVDFNAASFVPWIVLAAVVVRAGAKIATGLVVRAVSPAARGAGPLLGLGLMSSGAVAMSVGLAFTLRFPGPVGATVLVTAAVSTVLGEFVGPATLRNALRQAGEIVPSSEGRASASGEERVVPPPSPSSPGPADTPLPSSSDAPLPSSSDAPSGEAS